MLKTASWVRSRVISVRFIALVPFVAFGLASCSASHGPRDGGFRRDGGRSADSGMPLSDGGQRGDATVDAGADAGGPLGCVSNEECAASEGLPAAPEFPCGSCWAVCQENGECGSLCYEAADCIFTSGCGPRCEPLCESTENCLGDDECVGGVCVRSQ